VPDDPTITREQLGAKAEELLDQKIKEERPEVAIYEDIGVHRDPETGRWFRLRILVEEVTLMYGGGRRRGRR